MLKIFNFMMNSAAKTYDIDLGIQFKTNQTSIKVELEKNGTIFNFLRGNNLALF